ENAADRPVRAGTRSGAAAAPARSRRAGSPQIEDEFSVVVPSHVPTRVPGGDHLLLAAFPLAVSRPGRAGVIRKEQYLPGKPYKVIQDNISCPMSGRTVTRTLEVYGSKGPVQPSDEDVLIALIQFTHEYLASSPDATLLVTDKEILRTGGDPLSVMMRLRKIHFKRADLLRRLGIKHLSGKNQQLIEQRMHRLSGVDLAVKNAYFHADGTLVTSVGLRLIDSYAFLEGNRYAWFTWSPTMAQLIENGELRALDTDFYFRIDDFLARRLFRHLNIFGQPGRTTYSFTEIVKTRLGLEPSTEYVSKCKDPVERACRELVRHGFLKSYSIDGRFVSEATITLEMPADYQPSETFSLPFEALIDSFRKDAGEAVDPAARGGLWRTQCERIEKLAGKSPKARESAENLTRAIHDRYGPSSDALAHAIEVVEQLGHCGIKQHTAIPETVRLVNETQLTPGGVSPAIRNAIDWWARKRRRGEGVGPGLLVSALRDPERATDNAGDLHVPNPDQAALFERREPGGKPAADAEAAALWQQIVPAVEASHEPAGVRDWLGPVVPVALAGSELTIWVPNATFSAFLGGSSTLAETLRTTARTAGISRIAFAVDA
ncbi:MAG TPA: hypothetical protein PLF26_00920, partial [Blastocatellia bacterium]|nr:hypothetical protein [Blastocatellia bacterium]